jgi:murein DD-endopeptidase MepM/ murein hydrolase activator NlpD
MFYRGDRGTFGNFIKIQHSDHIVTAYAHLERFEPSLATGMRVKKGQVIGYVGTTGRSSGPHLHYEVLVDGQQIDPLRPAGAKIAEDLGNGLDKVATGIGSLVQQVGQSLQSDTASTGGLDE